MSDMTTGEKIKKIREYEGWSQTEMANALGTTVARISNWEHNRNGISIAYRKKFRDMLGFYLNEDVEVQIKKKIYKKELEL